MLVVFVLADILLQSLCKMLKSPQKTSRLKSSPISYFKDKHLLSFSMQVLCNLYRLRKSSSFSLTEGGGKREYLRSNISPTSSSMANI